MPTLGIKKIKPCIQGFFDLFTLFFFFVNSMTNKGNFIFQGQLINFLTQKVMEACGRHPFTLEGTCDIYPDRKKNIFFIVSLDALLCSLLNGKAHVGKGRVFYYRWVFFYYLFSPLKIAGQSFFIYFNSSPYSFISSFYY